MSLVALLTACGGPAPPSGLEAAPVIPPPETEPSTVAAAPEPEAPLDRWRAPFAVSSSGRVAPRERRLVVVLRSDTVLEVTTGGAAPIDTPLLHEVGPDDTLVQIAELYDVSPEAILELNSLTEEGVLPGQSLLIPAVAANP